MPVTFRASGRSGVLFQRKMEPLANMGTRRETTIERLYREVNGHKMPPSIKRILLPKRSRTRKVSRVANEKYQDEEILRAILEELRWIRSVSE
jgi:hypothetical protein